MEAIKPESLPEKINMAALATFKHNTQSMWKDYVVNHTEIMQEGVSPALAIYFNSKGDFIELIDSLKYLQPLYSFFCRRAIEDMVTRFNGPEAEHLVNFTDRVYLSLISEDSQYLAKDVNESFINYYSSMVAPDISLCLFTPEAYQLAQVGSPELRSLLENNKWLLVLYVLASENQSSFN